MATWISARSGRAAILGIALVIHLVLIGSLAGRYLNPLFNDAHNRPGPGADFFATYHAGRQVLTGRSPYQHVERPRVTPAYYAPFRYPPGVAWSLGAGVAWIKPWVAYLLWLVVLEALLLLCLFRVPQLFDAPRPAIVAGVRAGMLAFTPFYLELWMGQFTFVAAALTLLAVLDWRTGHDRRAAVWWGLACALKLFPLALAPALAARRRWFALAIAGGLVALSLAPLALRAGDWAGWSSLNLGAPEVAELHAGNFSLLRLLQRAGAVIDVSAADGRWATVAQGLTWGLAAITAAAMWRGRHGDLRVAAAAALLFLPLGFKDVWEHHYVVAIPALALMAASFAGDERRLRALAAIWLVLAAPTALVLLQSGPPTWYPDAGWSAPAALLQSAPKPLAALAGFGLCLHALWRAPRAATS